MSAAAKTPVTAPVWHPNIPAPDECRARANTLTARQQQMLGLVACGWQQKEIAGHLGVTVIAVRRCLAQTYRKLGVTHNLQALALIGRAEEEPERVEPTHLHTAPIEAIKWRPRSVFEMSAAELGRVVA